MRVCKKRKLKLKSDRLRVIIWIIYQRDVIAHNQNHIPILWVSNYFWINPFHKNVQRITFSEFQIYYHQEGKSVEIIEYVNI